MDNTENNSSSVLQLRLLALTDVDNYRFIDPLEGWALVDVCAMAIDPDPKVRRVAALSDWNWDIRLQRVLAHDPDELVVLNLLSRVDPPLEVVQIILAGPHRWARRVLAARNLPTGLLVQLLVDHDSGVQRSAVTTLRRRAALDLLDVIAR